MTEENSLKQSVESLGILVPVVRNKRTGHIIDGKHRTVLNPEAPVFLVDIPEEMEFIARLAINNVRRDADADVEEWSMILSNLSGVQGKKVEEIAKLTGISRSTIYRHMPQEFKDLKKSEAISEGRQEQVARATSNSKIQDTLMKCDRCPISTSELQEWHGHKLCPHCFQSATFQPEAMDGFFRYLKNEKDHKVPEPKGPTSAWAISKWSDRASNMQVPVSKAEIELGEAIGEDSLLRPFIGQKEFHLGPTTKADWFLTRHNVAIFYDGPPHDDPKQKDRDEELRELLKQWHPEIHVVVVSHKMSRKEQLEAIRKAV